MLMVSISLLNEKRIVALSPTLVALFGGATATTAGCVVSKVVPVSKVQVPPAKMLPLRSATPVPIEISYWELGASGLDGVKRSMLGAGKLMLVPTRLFDQPHQPPQLYKAKLLALTVVGSMGLLNCTSTMELVATAVQQPGSTESTVGGAFA